MMKKTTNLWRITLRSKNIRFLTILMFCLSHTLHAFERSLEVDAVTQSSRTLHGVVLDENSAPLPGVVIVVKETNKGLTTDLDGNFEVVVNKGTILEFSCLGYKPRTVTIGNQKILQIVLEENTTVLDDVVVVGYGSQKKISVVGSVQTIRPNDLMVPSTRLTTSFAGRLSGVIAVQRSGQPGADGADFWIRGISTFGGRRAPLIVVDGMQVSVGDLNNIDPEIIESFSILKDATATALYGTLGANGVMIVTTKSGKDLDKPKINVRVEGSVSMPINRPKFVDGVRYMEMFNEGQKNPSSASYIPYSQEKIDGTIAGKDPIIYPNVNWYNELFNKAQFTERALVNITGGSRRVDYFSSLSVSHESGMLKSRSRDFFSYNNNISLWRYNFQNNINLYLHKNTKLSVRLNVQLRDEKGPYNSPNGLFNNTILSNPVDFPVFYPYDTRNQSYVTDHVMWGGKVSSSNTKNPVAEMVRGYNTDFQSTVIAQIDLEQKLDFITKGLKLNAFISFKNWAQTKVARVANYNRYYLGKTVTDNNGNVVEYEIENVEHSPASTVLDIDNNNSFGTGDRKMYIQGKLDYQRTFDRLHNVAAMLMYNQEEYNINKPGTLKASLPYRKVGVAGRLTYSYDYKYLFEANFGYNGSENFAKGHRFGFFPSVAIGYNISQEKFWESLKPVVSNLKLRGSWGLVGNDQGGERFLYLSDLALSEAAYTTGINQDFTMSGPVYKRFQNNDLTWEVGEKINLGLDVELFRDLRLVFDVFKETRRDIFLERQTIPNFLGTAKAKIYGNLGKVENKGFEASFDYAKQYNDDLFLSIRGTFTYAANKILNYDEPEYKLYPNNSRVGHAVNQSLLFIADRLFIDDEEVRNSPTQNIGGFVHAGDIKYVDQANVNGVKDQQIDLSDRIYTGYPSVPEIVYGFGSSMQYKKWDFSLFFQGAARTSLVMSGFHPFGNDVQRNVLRFVADDYWSESNQNIHAKYPRLSIADNVNNTSASTYWQRNASFLKLKTMEVGYSFKFMRMYLSGSNLFTFSKFKHWDPEMGGGAGLKYPTMRVFNLGIQMTL